MLGINAVFHDPAAAIVVDGRIVAAAEEERFSRRKHGKQAVPFSTWELPERAIRFCLERAGLRPEDLDAVAYSYDPALAPPSTGDLTGDAWEGLRTLYAERADRFLTTALPGLSADVVRHVPHHVAHAASAYLAAPYDGTCSVMTLDGRGERQTFLAGRVRDGDLEVLASQELPHSLGLLYEALTEHLGFLRSSDEYKVMAMASYGEPRWIEQLREDVRVTDDGGFTAPEDYDFSRFVPRWTPGDEISRPHADLAATVQTRLEEVLLDLANRLHERTGDRRLVMAGGIALNCVANSRLWREGPFEEIWVQPAAGDAGTALGGALHLAHQLGDRVQPMTTAALGSDFDDASIEAALRHARVAYERPDDLAEVVAETLAANGIVAWFQGAAEFGPRALGHRSLLCSPIDPENTERLNVVKGREQFRPVAPMVHLDRAAEVFTDGPLPSPYMLFTHTVHNGWAERIPAAVHVDKSARAQTVDPVTEPLVARMLAAFEARTGVPVVINTSLNTAGRPIVDSPQDVLECFGSAPIDLLAIGPFVVRRPDVVVA
ncbi:carbamoyltransferase family protein [Egicoccus halophilus]|uniref:carbamoyltransferase family protein n=1 Tax=Egicoccus halophilus TaxID=1670830 RepID=UPI0010310D3C|nr:carbamoyltransferase C-terminal domain-containing protein [Egicoccus halophilus]